jgi:PhnB protein
MKELITYLNFDGRAREAMQFYQKSLGGDLMMQSFAEAKMDVPPESKDRIIHAKLTIGPLTLMASDAVQGQAGPQGENFHICVICESLEETEKLFNGIGQNGKVTLPLQDMFWGSRFGMLIDRFGINWMFNYDKPKS